MVCGRGTWSYITGDGGGDGDDDDDDDDDDDGDGDGDGDDDGGDVCQSRTPASYMILHHQSDLDYPLLPCSYIHFSRSLVHL